VTIFVTGSGRQQIEGLEVDDAFAGGNGTRGEAGLGGGRVERGDDAGADLGFDHVADGGGGDAANLEGEIAGATLG
jgi:hypothetical protein